MFTKEASRVGSREHNPRDLSWVVIRPLAFICHFSGSFSSCFLRFFFFTVKNFTFFLRTNVILSTFFFRPVVEQDGLDP